MISLNYVNGNPQSMPLLDDYFMFLKEEDSICESVLNDIAEYKLKANALFTESSIMGSNEYDMFIEAESPNMVEKLGKAIKDICNKAIEFIKSMIDAIKNIGFKNKSDMAKVETLIKKHPDLRDEIICSFQKGEFTVQDVKSFMELEKAYEEIIKMSKANENPNSIKAKWDKAVEKFKSADKSAIFSVAKTTAQVITAVGAVVTIRKYFNEANENSKKVQDAHIKGTKMAMDVLGSNEIKDMGNRQLILTATRFVNDQSSQCVKEYKSFTSKIQDGVAKFLDRIDPESGKKAAALIHDTNKRVQDIGTEEGLQKTIKKANQAIANANKAASVANKKANKAQRATKNLGRTVAKAKAMSGTK